MVIAIKKISILRVVIVNVLVILIFAASLELLLKLFYYNPPIHTRGVVSGLRSFYMNHDRKVVQWQPDLARYDEHLSYTLNPGRFTFSNVEYEITFSVNALGVRDDEASLHAPDIIVAGDSHAMGWGVEAEETFADRLEQLAGLNVLNTAISSYGTVREMKILERVDRSKLKALIVQYCQNDYQENKTFCENRTTLPIMGKNEFDAILAAHKQDSAYYPGKYLQYLLPSLVRHQARAVLKPYRFDDVSPDEHDDEAKVFIYALLHAGVALEKIKIIVFEINGSNANDSVFASSLEKEIAAGDYPSWIRKLKIVNAESFLTPDHYYLIDDHMNPKGHSAVAGVLWEIIRAEMACQNAGH